MERHQFLSERPKSFWLGTTGDTNFPKLTKKIKIDVAIVGGGIAGLTAGILLKQAGKKVAIIEADKIIKGATGYTTAKITSLHTLIYKYLIDRFGQKGAKQYADAQQAAIERIAKFVNDNNISCDFIRSSALTYTITNNRLNDIKLEVEAAKKLGLPASFEKKTSLPFTIKGAIRLDNQAYFHPRKYLLSLAKTILGNGSYIFENSRIINVKEGEPCILSTGETEIKAKDVIIATHFPILDKGLYFARLTPRRSYALAAYIDKPVPKDMFINLETPIFSLRPQPSKKGPLLIITGYEHITGNEYNTLQFYKGLEEMAKEKFKIKSIEYHWSTQDNHTIDQIPYIGRYTPFSHHLYVATGFGGWGMTNGTVSGMILSDMILGKANPWTSLFDPNRLNQYKSVTKIVTDNSKNFKRLISDSLSKFKSDKPANLKIGDGKIMKLNGKKAAVYKDEKGTIHAVSPICAHMGCIVNFNNAEKSWDCPCHGSRYDTDGNVLHSPTVKCLKKELS